MFFEHETEYHLRLSGICHARQALVTWEFCRAVGPEQRLPSGEQVLGWLGTRRTQVELPCVIGSAKGDERPGFWGIRSKRSPNRHG